jgi:hypothetical protein
MPRQNPEPQHDHGRDSEYGDGIRGSRREDPFQHLAPGDNSRLPDYLRLLEPGRLSFMDLPGTGPGGPGKPEYQAFLRARGAAISIEADAWSGPASRLTVSVAHGDKVTRKVIRVPPWEFFRLEQVLVRQRMAKVFADVPADTPLFFTSMPPGMSSADILPGRIAARTFDSSIRFAEQHVGNLQRFLTAKLAASTTTLFNFVAPPGGAGGVGQARWARLRSRFDEVAASLGLELGNGRAGLLRALEDGGTEVVVVVGHGDQSSIYLPDGSALTVQDILAMPPIVRPRAPIVVLLSCETGSAAGKGMTSIAEALMLRGRAAAILAPTRQISAGRDTTELLERLFRPAQGGDPGAFIKQLRGPWQLIVDTRPVLTPFGQAVRGTQKAAASTVLSKILNGAAAAPANHG